MARDPAKRWGDPKWTMRRSVMLGVFAWCGIITVYAFQWPPETIREMSGFVQAIAIIVMPVLLAYLGIPEVKQIVGEQPVSRMTQTTQVEHVEPKPDPAKKVTE